MIRTPRIPVLADPALIDFALLELQTKLITRFPWLDHAFGKAQQLRKAGDNGRVLTFPTVYSGGKEYLRVFPDEAIGNFSFFDVKDGEAVDRSVGPSGYLTAVVGLIFWFDIQDVYPVDWEHRTTENVKDDVLLFLNAAGLMQSNISVGRIFERPENIYPGYSFPEIEDQFLRRPFSGFRVELELSYYQKRRCDLAELTGVGAMTIGTNNTVA